MRCNVRKIKILVIVAILSLMTVGAASGNFFETHTQYFSDAQFDNMVGESIAFCDNSQSSWGSTGNYMGYVLLNCDTGNVVSANCYHWTGSSWESTSCFFEGTMYNGGRLRVPIG